MGTDRGPDPAAGDEDEKHLDQVDDAPSLDVVEPDEAESKRPAWASVPGTIKKTLMQGNRDAPLFGFHLEGGAVSERGVQIGFLAEFLEAFRKVFEPLQVFPTGHIPEGNRLPVTIASPPVVNALGAEASVTILFTLGASELDIADERNERLSSLLSVKAAGHLGALLSLDPADDILKSVAPFGKRIGRSYGQLADIMGENNVKMGWWSDTYGAKQIEVSVPTARQIADELIHEPIKNVRRFKVSGFMWDAATGNADQRYVRIKTPSGSIKATYDIPLTTKVTKALSHNVEARIRETSFRFPFAEKPHRREWDMTSITKIGDKAGALAQAEQLQLLAEEGSTT